MESASISRMSLPTHPDDRPRLRLGQRAAPAPNYTERGTKLRLLGYVACVMILLTAMERGAPRLWRWLGGVAQQAEQQQPAGSALHAGPRKVDQSTADLFDPVDRAWNEAWADAFGRLSADQRSLLFELLHAAGSHQPLSTTRQEAAAG